MSRPSGGRFGIILAAGTGSRFRGLKQFARLGGQPLFRFSVSAFERCPTVDGYVLVVCATRLNWTRRLVGRWRLKRLIAVVSGGRLRAESVDSGLRSLPEAGWVAIHDAARPFITPAMLKQGFAACQRHRAATFGLPLTDTLKQIHGDRVVRTIDRSSLATVQTPQFFELALIRKAHAQRGQRPATDDCTLVETLGIRPVLLPGTTRNLKVTTRTDLELCAALL
uniref:2-C-methyl-D-erythritol 4-phosphate cytidylyltransferase n=1 Tax=candidate division WOR-3 bacterium TaxID=2052148 RepID=A0A7C4CBH4_UNCW3